ncbi:molecular chaperone GrpE [Mariniphaga anaerophila]|uniref:Protein GrpE n=1 Tax=Mariniphaga anaerophila TaxID=1484053 RepID=A0A1M4XRI0_9BACT|nr:nucleotide exchange factor GrpE [Mariniphaga anaerophila]SHE96089.1 molecular chaperone GrpE [Mariniphaga anaerophila]
MSDNKMNKNNETQKEKDAAGAQTPDNNEETKMSEKAASKEKEEKKKKSKMDKKEVKIAELEEKLKDLSDKHLRLQAEFDNFRKRTLREKTDLIKSGGESVLTGILPVVDDFERAIQALSNLPEEDAGKQGTMLIYSKFKDFLKQNNVNEIAALHQDFDVDHHEAITKIPAPEEKLKGKVVDVIQKGYTLNDKVIRYAKVVVGE